MGRLSDIAALRNCGRSFLDAVVPILENNMMKQRSTFTILSQMKLLAAYLQGFLGSCRHVFSTTICGQRTSARLSCA